MSRLSFLGDTIEKIRSPIIRVLAAVRVRPNHLTLLGALIAVGAGYTASQGALLPAGLLFLGGSLMDGLDGALARHTDSVSRTGAFLDSVLDRVGEAALLIGLSLYFAEEGDALAVMATTAGLALSMLVSYARARAESLGLNRGGIIPAPRPIRVVILSIGLVIAQPLIAVIAIAALSAVSALQRIIAGMGGTGEAE